MKHIPYSILLIVFIVAYGCNKEDDNNDLFDLRQWQKHIDSTSQLVIIIPDIQMYTTMGQNTKYLDSMLTRLIRLEDRGYKIKAVLQTGDITNSHEEWEWKTAKNLFSELDGKIPYILCTGNHDYSGGTRETYYNSYFDFTGTPYFVTSLEKGKFDNSLFNISVFNHTFQIFSLEFAPDNEVLAWADSIVKANPEKIGMVLTHAYLYEDNVRFDFSTYGYDQLNTPHGYSVSENESINDGEEIWQKLIYHNDAFRFVVCGHMDYPDFVGNLVSKNAYDNPCLQMLFDTQSFPEGGSGFIQVLEFRKDQKSVKVSTCSLLENIWLTTLNCNYWFSYR
ncbi:MAG TPA: metallophosphoesterase [Bacteroidales bacterium]|nr:metallophosphoesterase [Bacteroidales bacterium]